MDMLVAVIVISLTLIVRYEIVGFCAITILIFGVWQKNQKKMFINLVSFFLAVILVIGAPLGLIKSLYPETNVSQEEILKEVRKWN